MSEGPPYVLAYSKQPSFDRILLVCMAKDEIKTPSVRALVVPVKIPLDERHRTRRAAFLYPEFSRVLGTNVTLGVLLRNWQSGQHLSSVCIRCITAHADTQPMLTSTSYPCSTVTLSSM